MALSKRVRIRYEVDTRGAKRGLNELERATERVRTQARQSRAELRLVGSGAGGAGKGVVSLTKSFTGFAASATAATATATAAAAALVEIADRAARSQVALSNLPFAIDQARLSTRGLVDDLTLAQSAITANRLGVTDSAEEFAKLTEAATKLGVSVGQDANKSVQDLTTALARQSPQILDNLGITLKVGEANEEYARRLGKLSSELTDAEKKQAFMTIGLERAQEAAANVNVEIDDTAQLILELKTQAANFADEFSREFVATITDAREGLVDFQRELRTTAEAMLIDFGQSGKEAEETVDEATDALLEAKDTILAFATLGNSELIPFLLNWSEHQKTINGLLGDMQQLQLRDGVGGVSSSLARGISEIRAVANPGVISQSSDALGQLGGAASIASAELSKFFAEAEKNKRNTRGRGRQQVDPFKEQREAFEAQLRIVRQQQTIATFAATADRERNAALVAYNTELARTQSLQAIEGDRLRAANDALQRRNELQQADLQRQVQLAELQGNPAEAFALEQEAFRIREENLRRQLELETEVGERERLQDELAQARHERTISRLQEEQRQREQTNAAIAAAINSVSAAEQGAFQLSGTIASATIQGEQRKKRVLDGIKAAGLFADGAVASAQAAIAYASGNIPQGIALTAAAANAFAQGAVVAAGNARGGGGGGGAGTSAGASLGRGAPVERAQFSVDRGAPLSVREGVEGNPNNTGRQGRSGGARVVNIERVSVTGTIDDETADKIRDRLDERLEAVGGN